MNKKCQKQYKLPFVQKMKELAWKHYFKNKKQTKKQYTREFKQGFMASCTKRKY
jgi:hypothetical protein